MGQLQEIGYLREEKRTFEEVIPKKRIFYLTRDSDFNYIGAS
jgi:hypothetical protein